MPCIFGVICFFGNIGNCIVIYTIVKKTKFRAQQTVPDIFIFSLSLVDLLFLLGMPFLIHQLLGNGSWCFVDIMCTVITALDSNSQIVNTYILTVMTLDHYLATVHPIHFNHVRTPCLAGAAVGLVWVLSRVSITPVWMYADLMPRGDGSVGCALLLPNPATDTYWFTLYQFVLAFAFTSPTPLEGYLQPPIYHPETRPSIAHKDLRHGTTQGGAPTQTGRSRQ
uniref:Melanin-concentrating hormone receptor 1 n=1 Tax=Oncorhynchus tshawytscha TaxID=74940 RepID=A0A8C8IN72_ONCTS